MRITNKMMTNTSLHNINNNKQYVDQVSTQIATRQKIVKPSDDPVIAIRALRLRSNLSDLEQYYEKNIPDAEAWMEATEGALIKSNDIFSSILKDFDGGSTDSFMSSDRKNILANIQGHAKSFYSLGNSDYAGRTLFTGYRTETQLTFLGDTTQKYSITQKFGANDMDTKTYISGKVDMDLNNPGFTPGGEPIVEQDVQENKIPRIKLAYGNLTSGVGATAPVIEIGGVAVAVNTVSSATGDAAYLNLGANEVRFIPETGEVLLGSAQAAAIKGGADVSVTYEKSQWADGDLRPEHYFDCEDKDNNINYQFERQYTKFDVSFKQNLRINTLGCDMFTHETARMLEEIAQVLEDSIAADEKVAKIEEMMNDSSNAGKMEELEKMLEAAKKEQSLIYEHGGDLMSHGITKTKEWQQKVNAEVTDLGNRNSRLVMVQARLKDQQTTFTDLAQENDGIDMEQTAVELKSAQLAYDSALLAIGKIAQTSLLNYL